MKYILTLAIFISHAIQSFAGNECEVKEAKKYSAILKTATDEEYPNNNMIGFKSSHAGKYTHSKITFKENETGKFNAVILPGNASSDTIFIKDINLLEMIPSIPNHVKGNPYLTYIALLNQEFNRIQVKFNNKYFTTSGSGTEKDILTRVDLANNCLSKGMWEVIVFNTENESDLLYFQCWFDFPEELYNDLFKQRNGVDISIYDNMLKNYDTEKHSKIDLTVLRKITSEKEITFENLNDQLYPIKGERQTKAKNIIYPTAVNSINDLLTDKSTFATFAAPGQYTQAEPRQTQLSRFQTLKKVVLCQSIVSNTAASNSSEFQLYFTDHAKTKATKLVIGGLQVDKLPILNSNAMHKGWQRPMGISNHSFYNAMDDLNNNSSKENAFYALLVDENDVYLDSHAIGIDGPLFFRDETDPTKLHLLMLSFERHAFIGHYVFTIPTTN